MFTEASRKFAACMRFSGRSGKSHGVGSITHQCNDFLRAMRQQKADFFVFRGWQLAAR